MFRVWRMAPWVRAPFLLLRRAGVASAVIAASFVATLPAAAAAPFLSSSTNATLHSQIRASCPSDVGDLITYDLHAYSPEDFTSPWPLVDNPPSVPEALAGDEAIEHRIAGVAASGAGLAAPEIAWHATNAKVQVGAQLAKVTSMTIPDFADHVHVVSGPNGDGAWIPDGFASAYHLTVGEPLVYKSNYGPPTKVRIAAIYRDIRSEPLNPAFCAMQLLIFGPRGALLFGDDTQNAIPPIILMDRKTFATGVIPYRGKGDMMFSLADPQVPINETPPVMSTIKRVDAAVGPAFRDCPGCESTSSLLSSFTIRSELAREGMKPTVLPISAAGVLVGLVVVAAAAVFWVLRRGRELTVLSAHGMGAVSLGVKAMLEALPALVIGAALAWFGASSLIRTAGPDPEFARSSIVDSLWSAIAALVAATIVVAVAAGVRCRTLTDERRASHRIRLAHWPWELLVIAAGVWAAISYGSATITRDAPGGDGGIVVQVPPKLLIIPLLLTVGCLMLLARITIAALRSRRGTVARDRGEARAGVVTPHRRDRESGTRQRRRPMVWYLGWRRVTREAAVVAVLAGATAFPIALATYGDAATRSVQATVAGEAQLIVGTDVVVTLRQGVPIPGVFRDSATEVLRLTGVEVAGNNVNLYAVDPAQFSKVAFWNDHIEGRSLGSILAPLSEPHRAGTPYPAVTSANLASGVQTPSWGFPTETRYDLRRHGHAPGRAGRLQVADRHEGIARHRDQPDRAPALDPRRCDRHPRQARDAASAGRHDGERDRGLSEHSVPATYVHV